LAVATIAIAGCCPASSLAADSVVNFDDLMPGTTVTNQYADVGGQGQGVVFGPLAGGAGDSVARPLIASAPGQAVSGSQVARIDCPTCNEGLGFVPDTTGTFGVPHARISVYVGFLGPPVTFCVAGQPTAGCAVVTLSAYDANGQPVGTPATAQVRQGQPFVQLSVTAGSAQIVGFEVKASNDDSNKEIAIDDLSFDAPSVPPAPDFTLTPAAASISVRHGQSASDQISIGRIGGSSGDISFVVGALPTRVHAQLTPNPATSQTTLTLTADANVPSTGGIDPSVTITGTPASGSAGPMPRSVTLRLHVESVCDDDVVSGQDLLDALAAKCTRINIADYASIDVAKLGYASAPDAEAILDIPSGVTLASDRSPTKQGGLLYMSFPVKDTDPTLPQKSMLLLESNTRVTGLRLRGYYFSTTDRQDPTSAIRVHDATNVLIDHNEFYGWPESGVEIGALPNGQAEVAARTPIPNAVAASGVRVTQNYFHDDTQCGAGYGVNKGGPGFALIDHNVFSFNRHDVAAGGDATGGYIAEGNFSLTAGPTCDGNYNQHYDIHGTGTAKKGYGGSAGYYVEIRSDAIRGAQQYGQTLGFGGETRPAFFLRGTPALEAVFADNAVEADSADAIKVSGASALQLITTGKLRSYGNAFNVNTAGQLAVGDFDGDGHSDVFVATGTGWFYSPWGRREWFWLRDSHLRLNRLAFGDFNGDGKTDVFTQRGSRWLVSYGGTGPWTPLPAGSNIPMKDYRFYDFNGDGKTDIFRANGKQWYYSSGGATAWQPLASSSYGVDRLRFCDFNGDGKTDVFSLANHQWSVSYGGTSPWQKLNDRISSNLNELVFGDFNGDGCDIARTHGSSWQLSSGGTSPWRTITATRSPESPGDYLVGDFNGDHRTDLLQFRAGSDLFSKFYLWSGLRTYSQWSLHDMP
jgi:hypothetical protein